MLGRVGDVGGLLEVLAGFVAFAHEVEDAAGSDECCSGVGVCLERFAIERQGLVGLAITNQLLALADELGLLGRLDWLLGEQESGTKR